MGRKPRTLEDFRGVSRSSGGQINFRECPVCGSTEWKTYLNPENGKWYCHAGRHGGGGQVQMGSASHVRTVQTDLLRQLAGPPEPEPWREIELPPWESLSTRACRYLAGRGLSFLDAATKFGMVEWTDKHRILIPYFDHEGKLIFWNSRRYSDNLGTGPKYLTAPGRHPLYVPAGKATVPRFVLVEGVFDAIAVRQHTPYQPIALGGKSLPHYLRKDLQKIVERDRISIGGGEPDVAILLDSDAHADAVRLVQNLPPLKAHTCRLVLLTDGDPADVEPSRLREALA